MLPLPLLLNNKANIELYLLFDSCNNKLLMLCTEVEDSPIWRNNRRWSLSQLRGRRGQQRKWWWKEVLVAPEDLEINICVHRWWDGRQHCCSCFNQRSSIMLRQATQIILNGETCPTNSQSPVLLLLFLQSQCMHVPIHLDIHLSLLGFLWLCQDVCHVAWLLLTTTSCCATIIHDICERWIVIDSLPLIQEQHKPSVQKEIYSCSYSNSHQRSLMWSFWQQQNHQLGSVVSHNLR